MSETPQSETGSCSFPELQGEEGPSPFSLLPHCSQVAHTSPSSPPHKLYRHYFLNAPISPPSVLMMAHPKLLHPHSLTQDMKKHRCHHT